MTHFSLHSRALSPSPSPAPVIVSQRPQTVSGVFGRRFVAWLDEAPAEQLWLIARWTFGLGILAAVWGSPAGAVSFVHGALSAHGWLLAKVGVSALAVAHWRVLWRGVRWAVGKWQARRRPAEPVCLLEGVPVEEVLHHLFERGTFKREEIERQFRIPRYRFDRLGAKLDELGVTVRDENNGRILNPEKTRAEVAELMASGRVAAELKPSIAIRFLGRLLRPTKADILDAISVPITGEDSPADLGDGPVEIRHNHSGSPLPCVNVLNLKTLKKAACRP